MNLFSGFRLTMGLNWPACFFFIQKNEQTSPAEPSVTSAIARLASKSLTSLSHTSAISFDMTICGGQDFWTGKSSNSIDSPSLIVLKTQRSLVTKAYLSANFLSLDATVIEPSLSTTVALGPSGLEPGLGNILHGVRELDFDVTYLQDPGNQVTERWPRLWPALLLRLPLPPRTITSDS